MDVQEAEHNLAALLGAVENRDETVLIQRNGKPVAELRGAVLQASSLDPLRKHPELAVTILYDPLEAASEEEWPSQFR